MILNQESILMLGEYKRKVRELFGNVDVHWRGNERMVLTASKILPNFYRNSNAGEEPVEENPIYIVVPSQTISGVWMGAAKGDEIRYGTAERHKDRTILTPTVGVFKGKALLLICLYPLDDADVESLEVGSLGM